MAEENEKQNPKWKPNDLGNLQATDIELMTATPAASGEGKWGEWNLWLVKVQNQLVYDRETDNPIQNYTGEAICFPSTNEKGTGLHDQFLKHTNGTKENVKIRVKKVPKKSAGGKSYTTYETVLLEEGSTPEGNLQEVHGKFLKDFKDYVDNGHVQNTKEDFFGFGTTEAYNISNETLEKLWSVHNEKKD